MSEQYRSPETYESIPVSELHSVDDLTQFLLTFRRNNGIADVNEDRGKRMAAFEARKEVDGNDTTAHFFGIKSEDVLIATGKLNVRPQIGDKKVGYLSFLSVDENFRGKGLAKQLTDARVDRARTEGCTYVATDVFTENPIALVTKFIDGYVLHDLEFYGEDGKAGKFILYKKIDGKEEYDKKNGPIGNVQEMELSDLVGIKTLIDQGWVGIDIKNIASSKDNTPKNWKLIMEHNTD